LTDSQPEQNAPPADQDRGVVIAVRPQRVHVRVGGETVTCDVRRGLQQRQRAQRTPLVVGDEVLLERSDAGPPAIAEILPRRSKISRVGSIRPRREHVIAANVDQLLALQSVDEPPFNARGLDRLLVLGEAGGVDCAVCINKLDLAAPDRTGQLAAPYLQIGYPVFPTSALHGTGLEAVKAYLTGKMSLIVGPSGGGKSTLLNRLMPGLDLPTREVSASSGRGVHTTTRVDYLPLPGGGAVLDTPGLRSIQPWIDDADLARHFPEMRDHIDRCRFRDCRHESEPACAVRAALDRKEIPPARYESYLRMLGGLVSEQDGDVGGRG